MRMAVTVSPGMPREVMGFGDVKLIAMIGAFLGMDSSLFVLMVASVAGLVFGALLLLGNRARRHRPVPFGPFLAAGTMTFILVGSPILDWYLAA